MAIEETLNDFVAKTDDSADAENTKKAKEDTYVPQYKMVSDQGVPISKGHGKLWESRKKAAMGKLKDCGDVERWDTAIAYYRNDHSERRDNADAASDKPHGTSLATKGVETENIVFANASALLPAVYAKNPRVEMSCDNTAQETFTKTLEKLVNTIFARKTAPGVNLKPRARRAVLNTVLTNISYIEVGWTSKEESSEQTLQDIKKIGEQLKKAKRKDLPQLEAQLIALEDKVDLLHSSGPWIKFRRPHDVLRDPDSVDLDDARWVMIADHLDTEFLKAVYGRKNDDGDYESVYKPTHVLKLDGAGAGGVDNEIASFSLFTFDAEKNGSSYGFDDEKAFKKAQRTKVWYIWDKATRRVYMYSDNDWSWPLWVWDDPYGFDNFFPIVPLEFYLDPCETYGRSETLMYLDQQDAINAINNEIAKVREYAMGKAIYNKNVITDEAMVENFLAGTTRRRALGVDVPPDVDLSKAFNPFVPQSAHVLNTVVFDKQRLLEAIDRVSSVTSVMRGVEYKTNTTNKAIDSYQSNTQTRLDEKIDAIEDFIGEIGWKIAQLCVAKMEPEMVAQLLGDEHAQVWADKPDLKMFIASYNCAVVGGSALKPTSSTKKEQAVQIGQILGQFASATPVSILIALQVMQRAFDEVVIRDEDWQMLIQSVQQSLGMQGQPSEGAPAGGGGGEDMLTKVEQIIDSMPPPAKKMLAQLLVKGSPIREAVGMVVQELQGAQTQPNPNTGE